MTVGTESRTFNGWRKCGGIRTRVTLKYYPEGNGKKKNQTGARHDLFYPITKWYIHSNRVLCSLTCAQHVNTQHIRVRLHEFYCPSIGIDGGARA